jgi:hypothetical protein
VSTTTVSTATTCQPQLLQQELQLLQDTTVKTATTAKLKKYFFILI